MSSPMLRDLVIHHREAILARCRARITAQVAPRAMPDELERGIAEFLHELAQPPGGGSHPCSASVATAVHQGDALLRSGLTVAQVVHAYGEARQAITDVASESDVVITAEERHALHHCLDHVIADAVTAYAHRHEREAVSEVAYQANQHLGAIAQDLHVTLTSAIVAFDVLRTGGVGVQGSTGNVLEHKLISLRDRLDRSLAEVRLTAGLARLEPIFVASLLEDLEGSARLGARVRKIRLTVSSIDRAVAVKSDRQILSSIISSLLQNAFAYTRPHSHVRLHTRATSERVLFEVEDQCGGISPQQCDHLLAQYTQHGNRHTGRGLELCVRGAKLLHGEIRVCNRNHGCLFTIDLPRMRGDALRTTDT